jgi:hypothetical protein
VGSQWENLVVDAADPARLAQWWAMALGYQITYEQSDGVEIRRSPEERPGLVFVPVTEGTEGKRAKNRLHLDLRASDREAEVERLVDMGARHAEIGQPEDADWTVLTDPEGNEFCVLAARG